ncbi:MurR/RpiR family transcriptional regulator [Clostridium taeniosporum]|uniref:MurR/RpiR family transcriptional regulator n=1 Tax=Clostridium taeniosporum TaxID=394958 RepID=A0A1D7XM24_9CLOT|nr:MurR/RpiR family transcriptional regulator [Clostridium taeniosporum]AOR24392.1 MurR/RpiR family transcriptional regulator [Clostridium taeniosporum]
MEHDIITQLQIIVNTSDEENISFTIAKVLLKSIKNDINDLTINDLADRCYTSISTISRFIKSLGYDSFNELKKKFIERKQIGAELLNDNLENMNFDFKNDKEILNSFVQSINVSLKEFIENLDLDAIDNLIDLIYEHKDIYFFGFQLPGYFMQHLQYLFFNIGKYINFAQGEQEQERLAKQSNEDSVSIIFSVDGNYLNKKYNVFYTLKEKGGKIILITQNPALKLAKQCDKVIYLGNYKNAKNGRYKLHVFSEVLINRYYLKYN